MAREARQGRVYYKLRFRRAGKQVVRYIGSAERATAVENELATLQAEHRIMHQLQQANRLARRAIRESKQRLEPLATAHGWAFHGLALRRPRQK